MSVDAIDSTFVTVASDTDVAELVCSVLEFAGYRIQRANMTLRKVTASQQQSESYGRLSWHYNFQAAIEWAPEICGATISITVREFQHGDNDTRRECQQRCSDLVLSILEAADHMEKVAKAKSKDTRYGSAAFGSIDELFQNGYCGMNPESNRLLIAPVDQGRFMIPAEYTAHHAIICGPTGTGKTSGIFIPNLIERLGTSMIVTEATVGKNQPPELFTKTAGWRKQAGHKIYWFNPQDMTSTRINPIDLVRFAREEDAGNRAEALADLVIKNTNPPKEVKTDAMWEKSEKFLLMALILHAAACDPKYGHLGAIRWNLLKGHERLARLMDDSPSELAADQFGGFIENATEGIRNGVVTGLLSRLNPWLTPQVVALTCKTDFRFEELQESLFTFYVSAPVRRTELKTIAALTLNFLVDLAVELQFKHGLTLLLDEFTNFGYVQGVTGLLSIIRKTGMSAVLGFQDFAQLVEVYGQTAAEIILSQPGTTVFYKPRTLKQARFISEALGTQTFKDRIVTGTGQTVEKFIPRPLMTPDELMSLQKYEAIVFTPTAKPMRLLTYKWQDYDQPTRYAPPEGPEHVIDEFIRRGGRTGPRQKRAASGEHESHKRRPAHDASEKAHAREQQERDKANKFQDKTLDRESPDPGLFGE